MQAIFYGLYDLRKIGAFCVICVQKPPKGHAGCHCGRISAIPCYPFDTAVIAGADPQSPAIPLTRLSLRA